MAGFIPGVMVIFFPFTLTVVLLSTGFAYVIVTAGSDVVQVISLLSPSREVVILYPQPFIIGMETIEPPNT